MDVASYEAVIDTTLKAKERTESAAEFETASLAEVADLDNLLGFKGNNMIFPLKEPNALTEFMAEPYIDRATNQLIDPDPLGNMNLDDFEEYVCCLKNRMPEQQFEERKPQLEEILATLLQSPLRNREDLIVPTDSLCIEALPAKHPILEDFKLMHRAMDVKKVQAEVRHAELENIRGAARLLSSEDNLALLDDPDVEKKIVINGKSEPIVVSSDNP